MKTYKQFITEAEISNEQMMDGISKAFSKYFPHGWKIVRQGNGLSADSIHVYIGLVGDTTELPSGIRENDPMFHSWILFPDKKGWSAESSQGSLAINPPEGSYLAMGSVKTKWRKTKGDNNKMVKTFDTFFKRLKALVKENESNIYGRNKLKDKYFK